MACVVPIDDDELNAGRAWVCTVGADAPTGEVKKPFEAGAGGNPPPDQDAPTLAGGKNSMLATCTLWGAPRVGGMG